jgi:hypothetical protein
MKRARHFEAPLSDRGDNLRVTGWIVACVALGTAWNVLAIVRTLAGTF